jgi:hypothetical protein
MGEEEIQYLAQHIITLRQILAVNCEIQDSGHPALHPTGPYGSAKAVQIAPGDLVRAVMPCPATQKPHTPTRPTAVSRLKRMFLHACSIVFAHPLTGKPLRLDARLPKELESYIARLDIQFDSISPLSP